MKEFRIVIAFEVKTKLTQEQLLKKLEIVAPDTKITKITNLEIEDVKYPAVNINEIF